MDSEKGNVRNVFWLGLMLNVICWAEGSFRKGFRTSCRTGAVVGRTDGPQMDWFLRPIRSACVDLGALLAIKERSLKRGRIDDVWAADRCWCSHAGWRLPAGANHPELMESLHHREGNAHTTCPPLLQLATQLSQECAQTLVSLCVYAVCVCVCVFMQCVNVCLCSVRLYLCSVCVFMLCVPVYLCVF